MRIKITARIKNSVLRLSRTKPHLGVRGIAAALAGSYQLALSKSAISVIIRSKGIRARAGRKSGHLKYQRGGVQGFGFLLLSCFNCRVGIFEHVSRQLHLYVPKISEKILPRIVALIAFAAASGVDFTSIIRNGRFLRLVGFYAYPSRTISYFLKRIEEYKPAINCEALRTNVRLVSTIKFYFENGTIGYCDAKFSTLWDAPCTINYFFLPFRDASRRVEDVLSKKLLMLAYTKSFDTLSVLLMRFIDGLTSGIKKIEFLGVKGELIERTACSGLTTSFCIGYYPKILNKGIFFLEKAKRFKRMRTVDAEVLYTAISTRFVQAKTNRGIILNNVLLKPRERMLPSWGILTNKKEHYQAYLAQYLAWWPYREDSFSDEMKIIERFFVVQMPDRNLQKLIPEKMVFEKKEDFAKIVTLLSALAQEELGVLDYATIDGFARRTKEAHILYSRLVPAAVKKTFNSAGFSMEGKRAVLI